MKVHVDYVAFGNTPTSVDIPVIVEKFEKHTSDLSLQKKAYCELSHLYLTIRQLVCFIAHMKLSDIATHNCPILDLDPSSNKWRRIFLYDLEDTEGADIGMAGQECEWRVGLIRSLWQKEHVLIALSEARRQGIQFTDQANDPEAMKREQLKKIEEGDRPDQLQECQA